MGRIEHIFFFSPPIKMMEKGDFWNYLILFLSAIGGILTIMQAQSDGKQSISGLSMEIGTAVLTAWVMFNNTRMNASDKLATVLPELGTILVSALVLHGSLRHGKK